MKMKIDPKFWTQLEEDLDEEVEREKRSTSQSSWQSAVCAVYPQADEIPEGLEYTGNMAWEESSLSDASETDESGSAWKKNILLKFPQAKELPDDLLSLHDAPLSETETDLEKSKKDIGSMAAKLKSLSNDMASHMEEMSTSDPVQEIAKAHFEQATRLPDDLCQFDDLNWMADSEDNAAIKALSIIKKKKSKDDLLNSVARVTKGQERYAALSDLAEIAVRELHLMVYDKELYLRVHTVWQPIDELQLVYELGNQGHQDLLASLSKKDRMELFQRVLMHRQIQLSADEINTNPALIPCKDGAFDVLTMRPRPTILRDCFFSCLNISAYEVGTGSGAVFETFVENLSDGNVNVRQRLLEIIGVILSGYMPKAFFLFIGPHDTGKSQAANLLRRLIGDKCVGSISDPNILSGNFGFSMLPGRKLCYCPDTAEIPFSKETVAAIKQITGGDDLYLNRKHRDPTTFVNEAKLLFISNHPLKGRFDDAVKSRAVVLPFQNTVSRSRQIPNLADKLYDERGYIVYQAVLALRDLIDRNFEYTPVDGTDIGFDSHSTDSVYGNAPDDICCFVENCCVLQPEAKSMVSLLYSTYQQFCSVNGYTVRSDSEFSKKIQEVYPAIGSFRTSSARGLTGIEIIESPMESEAFA